MFKNNCLFAAKGFVWVSGESARKSRSAKVFLYENGLRIGKDSLLYTELSDIPRMGRDGFVFFESNGVVYKWGRQCRITGKIDPVLTGFVRDAVSNAKKGSKSDFSECIEVAKKYVNRETMIFFAWLVHGIITVGFPVYFLRWFFADLSRLLLIPIVMCSGYYFLFKYLIVSRKKAIESRKARQSSYPKEGSGL
jgi:hypothetical protein